MHSLGLNASWLTSLECCWCEFLRKGVCVCVGQCHAYVREPYSGPGILTSLWSAAVASLRLMAVCSPCCLVFPFY